MKRVEVVVWSDFVCPWCWIAKRRLEQAIRAVETEVEVVVELKAYRLAKGMMPTDFATALARKFGSIKQAAEMMGAVSDQAELEGLRYRFDSMRFGDTVDAHALVKSAASREARASIAEMLFQAGTTDGKDIFDRAVLLQIGADAGIRPGEVDFEGKSLLAQIKQDEMEANAIASGVPLFVFNAKTYISGAQPTRIFERALRESAVSIDAQGQVQGQSCGLDGCS
ncbi:DsbA family oxidoreductase [Paraburkholderia sp. J10-1]|uniref:DsbA family oxidoreductase n=1 Tax=Paraburkholderia sp. J10-1 TaxID=2805430 RepID=UPI002AB7CC1A|nr:DsbA family oxidoreductase [Paraburkholderia sp. J10-1]